MIFGAITNSWRNHLQSQGLAELISEAESRGSRHIELRQTCLGDCESGQGAEWRPNLPGLEAIAEGFPDLAFDLAMALPCLTSQVDPAGEQFQMALEGAKIVGRGTPHLRVVDPSSFDTVWEKPADLPEVALGVIDLTREAARQGVILSIENSGQPIRSMALLVRECRAQLPAEAGEYLGLCPGRHQPTASLSGKRPPGRIGFPAAGHAQNRPLQAGPGRQSSSFGGHRRPGLWADAAAAGGQGLPGAGNYGNSAPRGSF